jgi:predicted nucleotidyltransferase
MQRRPRTAKAQGQARRIIQAIVRRLVEEYQPEKIILFGSYAYGRPRPDSDIDLLVVKETNATFAQRWAGVLRLVSPLRHGYAISPVVMTPEELAERVAQGEPFVAEILAKGEVLYAA